MHKVVLIDIERRKNRLLKFCYVPATSTAHNRLLFLLRPFTVLMKQTRQAVRAVRQSIFIDVYGGTALGNRHVGGCHFPDCGCTVFSHFR